MSGFEKRKVYPIPTAGFNTKISPMLLSDQEAAVLQNARMADTGLLEKYPGYIKDGSPFPANSVSFIRMLLDYKRGTSVDYLIMAAQDNGNANTNYKVDFKKTIGDGTYQYIGLTTGTASFTNASTAVTGSGTSWSTQLKAGDKIKASADADTAYVEIQTVNSDTSLTLVSNYSATHAGAAYVGRIVWNYNFVPRGVVFDNKAVFTNGSEAPMSYDATTLALLTSANAPKARYIEVHKNRLFMANTASNPSSIFWSYAEDETTWDAASTEPISSAADGGTIVAIRSFADSLIVFKNGGFASTIYQVIGNFDDSAVGTVDYIRKIDCPDNVGIISERTPVNHKGYLYFLAETGLYRIDQRMFVQKVTYATDGTLNTANFALGPSQSKAYTFNTQTLWQNGTLTGSKALTNGKLTMYFDEYTLSNALQGNWLVSCTIDSSFNVHVAYIDSANSKKINYVKIATDGTQTSSSAITESFVIRALSIAVATNGTVGIAYSPTGFEPSLPAMGSGAFQPIKVIEQTSGTWGSAVAVLTNAPSVPSSFSGLALTDDQYQQLGVCSLTYDASNNPWVAFASSAIADYQTGPSNGSATWSQVEVFYRPAGSWSRLVGNLGQTDVDDTNSDGSWSSINTVSTFDNVNLLLNNSGNPRVIGHINTSLYAFKSDNGGGSWSTVDTFSVSLTGVGQLSLSSSGDLVTGYIDSADTKFKKRDHTTTTTTTIDATTGQWGNGYIISSITVADQDYGYNTVGTSPNQAEKYWFESGSSISNGTVNTTSKSYKASDHPFAINGNVFASVAFGASANTIKVNRVSFRGIWQSPQESDSTLTAWGTYAVTNQVNNSATITHQIALSQTNPASVFNAITPGAIISSDPTQIYAIAKITMVLGGWSAPSIDALALNYTGSGIDSKQAIGYVFNNELYMAFAQAGAANNNYCLVSDINDGLLLLTYPLSAIERFKNKLYAASALQGDLLILKQGYDFAGSSYTLDVQSREDFLDSIELQKNFTKCFVLFKTQSQSSFTFQWRVDNFSGSSDAAWTSTTIDGTKYGIVDVKIGAFGRSFQWRITDASLDDTLQIAGVVLVYNYANLH